MQLKDQTKFYTPETQRGNCLITCYACYFDLPIEECPAIEELFACKHPHGFWFTTLTAWLEEYHGVREKTMNEDPFLAHGWEDYYFATGPSARGCLHYVIYKDGKLFHDPHPSKLGLEEIHSYTILVPKDLPDSGIGTFRAG